MMTFGETMAFGAGHDVDLLRALDRVGLPSTFTQTGGMNAAIEIQFETGQNLVPDSAAAASRGDGAMTGTSKVDTRISPRR